MTSLPSLIARARSELPYNRLVQEMADELEKFVWRGWDEAPINQRVLIILGNGDIMTAWREFETEAFYSDELEMRYVNPTHWMPLPAKPSAS